MRSYEDSLSTKDALDSTIDDYRSAVDETFTVALGEADDILQLDLELQRNTELLLKFSEEMSKWMSRGDSRLFTRDAIYRSICFAAQVCDYTLKGAYEIQLIHYMVERTDNWRNIQAIAEDSEQYLDSRPHIAALISDYMPDIDPSGDCGSAVELFASLSFMLAERSVGEQQVQRALEDMSIEDFQQP